MSQSLSFVMRTPFESRYRIVLRRRSASDELAGSGARKGGRERRTAATVPETVTAGARPRRRVWRQGSRTAWRRQVPVDWRDLDNKLSSRGVTRMCPVCEHDEPWLHSERVVGLILVDDDGASG